MARRRQTTGMPRKDRQKDDTPENPSFFDNLLGNPTSRVEREAALNRLIQRSVATLVGAIILIIVGILVYTLVVVPYLTTVVTVNGDNITVNEFRNRVDFERAITLQNYQIRYSQAQQQAQAFGMDVNQLLQQDPQISRWEQELRSDDVLGNRVLDDMINDLLIKQEFDTLGLSIDDSQIASAREDFFGFDPTQVAMIGTPATATVTPTVSPTPLVSPTPRPTQAPTNTPTITPSPTVDPEVTAEATEEVELTEQPTVPPTPTTSQTEAYENYEESVDNFEQTMLDSQATRSSLDAFWEREAIREAVQAAIVGDVETTLYANARHILVETEEEANSLLAQLQTGESFGDIARANSTDTGSGQRGGELGWQAIDLYVPEFADAIRNGEIGALIGPIETEFGFHIIQVIATEEREVTGQTKLQVEETRFQAWLQERREEVEAEEGITINESWPDFLG